MRERLQDGTDGLDVTVPGREVTVLSPLFVPGLPDEEAAFLEAVRAPLSARPLAEIVGAHERVAIVIADVTRPLPSDRLLPWILRELSHVPEDSVTIVIGTGSHRATTPDEVQSMVGSAIAGRYKVVDHTAFDPATLAPAGTGIDGQPVLMNREYVNADRRIVVGFVEPHFMAGFSGRIQGRVPRRRGHRLHHAVPRRAHDRAPGEHVGPAGGQPDAGADPARRCARCPSTSASTSR